MNAIKTYLKKKSITSSFKKEELNELKNLMEAQNYDKNPALKIFVQDPDNLFDFDDFKNVNIYFKLVLNT